MTELRTARLRLRRFTEADVAHLVRLDSDPEVLRYAEPDREPAPPEAYQRAVLGRIRAGYADGHEFWAAEEDGAFVGWFFLRPDAAGEWELGYRLSRAAWGRGLATEGARAVLAHGFATLALPRVYAEIFAAHARSLRVVEKLGFEHVGSGEWKGMPDRRYELRAP